MTRLNKILIGLLVVQLALAVLVLTRGEDTVNFKESPVLAGFDPASVDHLLIYSESADKPAVDIVKRGNEWILASHFDYPVDAAKVTSALTPLSKMTAGEPIATQASKHAQLRVDDKDFERKLVVTANGKDTTLYLGTSPKLKRTAVRLGGDDRVLGASNVSVTSLSPSPRDWIALNYVSIPRDDIDKITIQRGDKQVELDRTGDAAPTGSGSGSAAGSGADAPPRTWRVSIDGKPVVLATGEKLDAFAIDTILSEVAVIAATPADPKRADKPTATITIARKSGFVELDLIGDADSYWVKQRGVPRASKVDKLQLEAVMGADRSKLVAKPEPAGSGSGSGSGSGAPVLPRPPKRP